MAYKDPLDERARAARRKHYEANKEQYFRRNEEAKARVVAFLLEYKNTHACVDCGITYVDEPWLLEFDHLGEQEKFMSVSQMASYGMKRVLQEIDKCELVCVVCHKRRTARRGGWLPNRYLRP